LHFRSFVFNNIPGYTFIFAIAILFFDSLQHELGTRLISSTWFFQKACPSAQFLAKLLVFHQHSRFLCFEGACRLTLHAEPTNFQLPCARPGGAAFPGAKPIADGSMDPGNRRAILILVLPLRVPRILTQDCRVISAFPVKRPMDGPRFLQNDANPAQKPE
jgi:hypothetical protein